VPVPGGLTGIEVWGEAVPIAYAVQRLCELVLDRRHTAVQLARGGRMTLEPWYPAIVALHAAWLAGLAFAAWGRWLAWPWLVPMLALQGVRAWTMAALGERWTTRIVTVPGENRLRRGPYRWFAHPNYAVVAAEIALVPLAFGQVWLAIGFSALNAPLLALRIRAETRALTRSA
jgi:methyltransferase